MPLPSPTIPSVLTDADARARLAAEGPNTLAADAPRSALRIALDVAREPMILLLVATALTYLALGDAGEAITLGVMVFGVAGITLASEHRAERAVAALRDLTSPRARVIRRVDGEEASTRIAGADVVRGDLLLVAEGDRIAADGVLLDGVLTVDASLLTGESVPVHVTPGADPGLDPAPPDDGPQVVHAGTLVVHGRGGVRVTGTGSRTAIGRIGRQLATEEVAVGPLHAENARIVRVVGVIAVALCGVVVAVRGLRDGAWLDGLLDGLTLAMAVIPEELPVVLTVFLALASWRLAARHVLVRRTGSLGALGGLTVLCTDKTGTLTENRMTVQRLVAFDGDDARVWTGGPLDEPWHALLEYAVLASQRDPFDPMEAALHALARAHLEGTEHLHDGWRLDATWPLSPELLALCHAWADPDDPRQLVVAAKGAPEAVIDLCHLPPMVAERVGERVRRLAADGLRALAVARARLPGPVAKADRHDYDFELLGLVGFADPLRPEVPDAIRRAGRAGVRVVMITGDHPATARAIAVAAGLDVRGAPLLGPEITRADDATLRARLADTAIVARATPDHKLRLVQVLRADGQVVGMTGDGVNDAPALRVADVGVAMGARGTDVAREAAAIVLTDDGFASIIDGVALARGLTDRMQRAMTWLVAVHVPMAGLSVLPVLVGWPTLLAPIHVVALELLIDPACTLVFDAEPDDGDPMDGPPRPPGRGLLGRGELIRALVQGAAVLLAVLAAVTWGRTGETAAELRAIAFPAFLAGNVAMLWTARSWRRGAVSVLTSVNRPAWVITAVAVALVLGVALTPLRALFSLAPVPAWLTLGACAAAVAAAWLADLPWAARRRAISQPS